MGAEQSGLPEIAPNQYGVGQPCVECKRPLSRYNPYVVCGPCRVRLASQIAEESVEADANCDGPDLRPAAGGVHYTWERFARRVPVRRGPLMTEP